MKALLSFFFVPFLLIACSQESSVSQQSITKTESERLSEWFDARYEEELQMSPMTLTSLGRKDQYDQVDDMSEAADDKQFAWLEGTVNDLKSQFDYQLLNDDAKVSYDIWMYQYNLAKAAQPFRRHGYVFTQMQGAHAFLPNFLINFHRVDNIDDMNAYIARLSGVSRALGQLLDRAKLAADEGIRPPRFAYEGVIDQATKLLTGKPFDSSESDAPLWADAKSKIDALLQKGDITTEQAGELQSAAEKALLEQFQPAYKNLIAWMTADLANTDADARGASALPNGEAFYNYRLRHNTTLSLTADEVHNIGLAEVARIRGEMEAIKESVGFEGDLQAFFEFIRTDEQFFYPNTDEGRQGYIDDSSAFFDFMKREMPKYFGILPKADLVVKRVEAFREQDGAAQHYYPGTPDGSRPGVYYAHLSDMNSMPKNEMEAIAYHEGYPGHHMQISIAQELESVPQFRTQLGFTAYVEGWALYSELLSKEMGAYNNPYSDFGRLITEMWRAIRLVVDTGLHSKGWSEMQARQYFYDNSPIAEGQVISEVRRYLVWPGQATAYKMGMLKIIELRAKAENVLGDKFDIRGFHDAVLGGGAVPLPVLERVINDWIDSQRV
ncbi:MAG TPA: DUF885 domain-containing protein [Pseudomonadales bacterium]|nr:DUF885 domain-containing protein [Pseudomonadales bacterium]